MPRKRGMFQSKVNVGAAEGCDLLILLLEIKSKDRSLRQLLQMAIKYRYLGSL